MNRTASLQWLVGPVVSLGFALFVIIAFWVFYVLNAQAKDLDNSLNALKQSIMDNNYPEKMVFLENRVATLETETSNTRTQLTTNLRDAYGYFDLTPRVGDNRFGLDKLPPSGQFVVLVNVSVGDKATMGVFLIGRTGPDKVMVLMSSPALGDHTGIATIAADTDHREITIHYSTNANVRVIWFRVVPEVRLFDK